MVVVTRIHKADPNLERAEVVEAKLKSALDVIESLLSRQSSKAFATQADQDVDNHALAFLAMFGRGAKAARDAELERAYEAWEAARK